MEFINRKVQRFRKKGYTETRAMKGEPTKRTQFFEFKLRRAGIFTPMETAVLCYIESFSQICIPPKMDVMAQELKTTRQTLWRVLKKLNTLGIVIVTYGRYKKLRIKMAALEVQKDFRENGPGKAMLQALKRQCEQRSRRQARKEKREAESNQPKSEPEPEVKKSPEALKLWQENKVALNRLEELRDTQIQSRSMSFDWRSLYEKAKSQIVGQEKPKMDAVDREDRKAQLLRQAKELMISHPHLVAQH